MNFRPYIFEGYCGVCRKVLKMRVRVEKKRLILDVVECKKHPDNSFFLLPSMGVRNDIEYVNRPDLQR